MIRLAILALLAFLAGCTAGPPIAISHQYKAASQDSRAQYLILHYTYGDWNSSLNELTKGQVSSHYLVRDDPVEVYQLVDESRRAYHAGASSWKGQTQLNAASIGIEIVNAGSRLASQGIDWQEYPKAQVDAVVALVKWIVERHEIRADRILGHSDIAPTRKTDPGPKFPWKRLADEGLIPWPDAKLVAGRKAIYETDLPDITWFQQKLAAHGFGIAVNGTFDDATLRTLAAFQMKYRQERFDGQPDAETAALLDVMTSAPFNAP
jgi:N-acetylmuramoyl-L-alanine amidase